MYSYFTSKTNMKDITTSIVLAATVAGIALFPVSASAMRYDRINKSLPGQCLSKEFRLKAAKFCADQRPAGLR